MADENKDQRVVVLMTPSESAAIDEWSFANRIRSKGEAIRRLCQIGMIWDGNADRLSKHVRESSEAFSINFEKTVGALGEPSDDLPSWVLDYVLASTAALMAVEKDYERLWQLLRFSGLPAAMLRDGEDFNDAMLRSLAAKAETSREVLQGALDAFEQAKDNDK